MTTIRVIFTAYFVLTLGVLINADPKYTSANQDCINENKFSNEEECVVACDLLLDGYYFNNRTLVNKSILTISTSGRNDWMLVNAIQKYHESCLNEPGNLCKFAGCLIQDIPDYAQYVYSGTGK